MGLCFKRSKTRGEQPKRNIFLLVCVLLIIGLFSSCSGNSKQKAYKLWDKGKALEAAEMFKALGDDFRYKDVLYSEGRVSYRDNSVEQADYWFALLKEAGDPRGDLWPVFKEASEAYKQEDYAKTVDLLEQFNTT